jgi:hypothetical protein
MEDVHEEGATGVAPTSESGAPLVPRLLVAGAALASLALLVGAVMLVFRLAQPPDYQLSGRGPDGEIVGRLAQVESGVILIQPEAAGGTLVPLLLSKGTRITAGAHEGWVGDLRPGGPIRVAYELYEGKRLAQSVEVLGEMPARRALPSESPTKTASGLKPAAPPAEPSTVTPAAPPAATPPPGPAPRSAPVVVQSARPPRPAAPAVTAPAAPPVREPDRVRDTESTDGSAAVDWLLSNRR